MDHRRRRPLDRNEDTGDLARETARLRTVPTLVTAITARRTQLE